MAARLDRVCHQDCIAGSGTTLAVAKKLNRRFVGFESSRQYTENVRERLRSIKRGDPLDGPADPLTSVPSTAEGRRLSDVKHSGKVKRRKRKLARDQRNLPGF